MPAPPRLSPVELAGLEPAGLDVLRADADIDQRSCRELEGGDLDARHSRLSGCSLVHCHFGVVDLAEALLFDVVAADTRLVQLDVTDTAWRDVVVERCRAGAVVAAGARLHRTVLRGCRIDLLSLRGADLQDVLLEDCVIDELDLSMAQLHRVAFDSCRIGRLVVHATVSTDVDATGASLAEIEGIAGLRGMTLRPDQLIALAAPMAVHLGIDIAAPGSPEDGLS